MPQKLITLFVILFTITICNGQNLLTNIDRERESFDSLDEGLIKKDIANFNIAGGNYEHRNKLIKLNLTKIPISNYNETSTRFALNGISIYIQSKPFESKKHKLTYSNSDNKILELIDEKPIWGTDGGLPTERIARILCVVGQNKFVIPEVALKNLFEPNFCYNSNSEVDCHCEVFRSLDGKRIYIYMLNGDGAGGYEVTFVIEKERYTKRVIDHGF